MYHREEMLLCNNNHTPLTNGLRATSRIPRSQTVSCSDRSSEWISGFKKSNLHCQTDHIPEPNQCHIPRQFLPRLHSALAILIWSNSWQSQEQIWHQRSMKAGVLLPSTEGRCGNWLLIIWILTLSHYIMYVHRFVSHLRNVHVNMF